MAKAKTGQVIAGAAIVGVGLWLLTKRGETPPSNGGGNGDTSQAISLRITNAPAGSVYWATSQAGILGLSEAVWWLTSPGHITLQINFLDASYNLVGEAECDFNPGPGMNYLMDINTCNVTIVEPPGPPPEQPREPSILSADTPIATFAESFWPTATLFIPSPDVQNCFFYLNIRGWGTLMKREFMAPEYIYLPEEQIALDRPDETYNVGGCLTYAGEWPEGHYIVSGCLPTKNGKYIAPGTYTIDGRLFTNGISKVDGEVQYGTPQQEYNFPAIATLVVQEGATFVMSNLTYPSRVYEGSVANISFDVTNTGAKDGMADCFCLTDIPGRADPIEREPLSDWLRIWRDVFVPAGQTSKATFSVPIPSNYGYNHVHARVGITGITQKRISIELID